jgi:hypothetical protein
MGEKLMRKEMSSEPLFFSSHQAQERKNCDIPGWVAIPEWQYGVFWPLRVILLKTHKTVSMYCVDWLDSPTT